MVFCSWQHIINVIKMLTRWLENSKTCTCWLFDTQKLFQVFIITLSRISMKNSLGQFDKYSKKILYNISIQQPYDMFRVWYGYKQRYSVWTTIISWNRFWNECLQWMDETFELSWLLNFSNHFLNKRNISVFVNPWRFLMSDF